MSKPEATSTPAAAPTKAPKSSRLVPLVFVIGLLNLGATGLLGYKLLEPQPAKTEGELA